MQWSDRDAYRRYMVQWVQKHRFELVVREVSAHARVSRAAEASAVPSRPGSEP